MENKDIRWKQRFQNFEKAKALLENALEMKQPDIIYRAGIIQFFEMTFELSWKTLKDYLQEQGFAEIKTPRESIKKAFEIGLLKNGHKWMKALEDRNLTAHTYDEATAIEVERLIRNDYYPLLDNLYSTLLEK